jgi:hypothetical protein
MANVTCPHCGKEVSLNEAIKKEISADLEKQIVEKIKDESRIEIEQLQKDLEEKNSKVKDLQQTELMLRAERRKFEEEKEQLELTVARRVDEERQKVALEMSDRLSSEFRLKELEKDKMISDLKKSLEDAQRRASQGSQQLQGEVLELDLEKTLKDAFPADDISPVAKGVRGADISQTVKTPLGNVGGVILWEIKRTKAWSDDWVIKLKDDARATKADIPVIVSTTFPKNTSSHMINYDGVWVVSEALVLPVASLLRKSLLDVARQKAVVASKSDKASMLYDYITGQEFKSQIEAMVESYSQMREDLNKERVAFEKIWKSRESQLNRLMQSTVGIYGGVQGLIGNQMPQIKGVELLGE